MAPARSTLLRWLSFRRFPLSRCVIQFCVHGTIAAAIAVSAAPSSAQGMNTCTITILRPGQLGVYPDGTTLSSEQWGGLTALIQGLYTGKAPSLLFTAPTYLPPSGAVPGSTAGMWVHSANGLFDAPYSMNAVIAPLGKNLASNNFYLDARVQSSQGFRAGQYRVSTTVTCQAP